MNNNRKIVKMWEWGVIIIIENNVRKSESGEWVFEDGVLVDK